MTISVYQLLARDHQGEGVNPDIGSLARVIHLNLFLDMVPSSSANFTRAVFPRCVFRGGNNGGE